MIVYIDNEFKCHLNNDGTMKEIETNFFDNKCKAFIEGYRFVPAGDYWEREDGMIFNGEMIAPWRDYSILAEFQAQYDKILAEA